MAFAHPLVREAALSCRLAAEQRTLHQEALELRRALPNPPPAAELAVHAEEAGDLAALAEFARQAAFQAIQQGAFHEAGAFFDRTIGALQSAGTQAGPELLSEAAGAWLAAGRAAHAAALLRELAACLERNGQRLKAVEARARAARAHAGPDSAQELERDIAELQPLGPTTALAMALATWAHLQAGGRSSGGRAIFEASEQALALARTLESPHTLATALLAHGHIVANAVDFNRGCNLLEECLYVARAADAPREEHAAAINLVSLLAKAGQYGRASTLAREAAERALEHGAHRRAGQLLARLSDAERQQGNWEHALKAAQEAVLLTDEEDPQSARAAREVLAAVLLRRHEWGRAEQLIVREMAASTARAFFPVGPWMALDAELRVATGEVERALHVTRSLHELWLASGEAFYGIQYCETHVDLLCRAGCVAEAKAAMAQAEKRYQWLPGELRNIPCASLLSQQALTMLAEGRPRKAARLWAESGDLYATIGVPFKEARARQRAAEAALLSAEGSLRALAREQLTRAHEVYVRLGSLDALVTERSLRKQQWMKRDRSLGLLSRREQEIVGLVAAGFSNQQIATRLVISKRTVDNHLARMFMKLDVHSRAALVGHAPRDGTGR